MSLLPQRKKSAEEIAKLRESLGIPGAAAEDGPASAAAVEPMPESESLAAAGDPPVAALAPAAIPVAVEISDVGPVSTPASITAGLAPLPVAPHGVKPVRSLKRSERIPSLPLVDAPHPVQPVPYFATPAAVEAPVAEPPVAEPAHRGRVVRSLRKSERVPIVPVEVQTPPPNSALPVSRRSDEELAELRRQSAIAMQQTPMSHPALQAAHWGVVIPGYLAVAGGGASFYFYDQPITMTAGCVAAALAVAVYILFKKPLSRHHGAFITAFSVLVIVFGALHYFPQLRHGT